MVESNGTAANIVYCNSAIQWGKFEQRVPKVEQER